MKNKPTHIIWKRPDGFQNSRPEDFRLIGLSNGAQLWLHRFELDWYPFQVRGDWSGEQDTKKLNRLINMLDAPQDIWKSLLESSSDNDISSKGSKDIAAEALALFKWVSTLTVATKGDSWEVEIIQCALNDVLQKIKPFL